MSKVESVKCDKCGNLIAEDTGGTLTYSTKTSRNGADICEGCFGTLGVHFTVQKKRGRKPRQAQVVAQVA